jgi:ribonuclease P protein component
VLAIGQRLRRRNEFSAVVRAGRRAGRGGLVVHVFAESGPQRASASTRAGFIVPKAVGPAVVRNRVRRQLRHLVRERLTALPVGTDVVVRVQPSAVGRSYEQLGADLDAAIAASLRPQPSRKSQATR